MGIKCEGCSALVFPLLPNVTALLLLAGAFFLFNWPHIAVRPANTRLSPSHVSSQEMSQNCSRLCVSGTKPRNCYFKAVLQINLSLPKRTGQSCESTNSKCLQRPMLSINGQLPGPPITVCGQDMVIVDVENNLPGLETGIHWHGLHQLGSPYMDGVPMITQCPIQARTIFRYKFRAANSGTHFYHAQSVFQHSDGLFGPLIVKQPRENDINAKLFDWDLEDHVITVFPWTESILAYNLNLENTPNISSVLINGQGLEYGSPAKFLVNSGGRYRFRIINAASLDCPIRLQVEKHTLTVIESDGSPIEPINLPHIILHPGERFDVVISTNHQPSLYWIGIQGYHLCKNYNQVAYFEYHGANKVNSSITVNDFVKRMTTTCPDLSDVACKPTQLQIFHKTNMDISKAALQVYQPYSTNLYDGFEDTDLDFSFTLDEVPYYPSYLFGSKGLVAISQVNHLTFLYPSAPILSQPELLAQNKICKDGQRAKHCEKLKNFCECFHVIHLPLNTSVDLVLIDEGIDSNYSTTFHIHGYSFLLLASKAMGRSLTVDIIKKMDAMGQLQRNFINPPKKDTVVIPKNGYAILRLFTNNPGYWLLESQSSSPSAGRGLEFAIKVGDEKDLPPVPAHFPQCGIFKGPDFIF